MATTWIYSDRHIFPYTTLLRSVDPSDDVDWSSGPDGVTTTGLDNIDLWIGGLAEKILPFGGMLGSTFNFVFEVQMEQQQNADRFRSEEHTSELQSLMRITYDVSCLKQKRLNPTHKSTSSH